MAEFVNTPMTGQERFNKYRTATQNSPWNQRFDSKLEKSVMSNQNCTLRITLRVNYRRLEPYQLSAPVVRNIAAALGVQIPAGATAGLFADSDGKQSIIRQWRGHDWPNFITTVNAQAQLWDGQFWLIPPDDFPFFDITEGSWTAKTGSKTFRPNVKCEFKLEMVGGRFGFHATVDVVNLLSPWGFRSESRLYSSADAVPQVYSTPNNVPNQTTNTTQPTITHEIGHLLGLPHIGVSRNRGLCHLAIVWSTTLPKNAIPALYSGDRNASVCYGTLSTAGDIDNIMGYGSKFSAENAKPWLDRIVDHLNLPANETFQTRANLAKWKVSMNAVPPRQVR